jgi:hypothetical protein
VAVHYVIAIYGARGIIAIRVVDATHTANIRGIVVSTESLPNQISWRCIRGVS